MAADGSKRRESLKEPSVTGKTGRRAISTEPYEAMAVFTVDGIPLVPGESWQNYHARALAWITIEASTIPANQRFVSRGQFIARLAIMPVIALFAIMLAADAY